MTRSHVLVPLTLALAGCFNVDELAQPLIDANTEILERQAANEQDIATLYLMATELQTTVEPLAEALVQMEQTRADLQALQADLDELALRSASAEEVAALQATAEALQTDLDNASTRLTTLENADIATIGWVNDQGFATAATTADLDTRLTATEASQLTVVTDMAALVSTASDLDTRLTSQEAVATQALTEFDALTLTVDGLQEDVLAGTEQLTSAQEDLLTAQEDLSGLQTTLQDLQTTVEGVQTTVDAQQTTLTAQQATVDALQLGVDDQATQLATTANDLAALQAMTDGQAVLLETAAADIASVRFTAEQNLDAIVLLESDVTGLSSALDALEVRLGSVEADALLTADELDGLAADLGALDADLSGLSGDVSGLSTDTTALEEQVEFLEDDLGALEADVAGVKAGLPTFDLALYETVTDGGERTVAGRQGLQLHTADGAFYLSASMTGTDFASDTIHWVTLYVSNPTDDDITVDLEGCAGDATDLFLDGALHTAATDLDGACDATWSVTFAPGSHTLQLRSQDIDAHNEGFGIGAGWVTTSGLLFDQEAFEAAAANDPVR